MTREILPFGGWPSPISAEMAAGKSLRFGMLAGDGDAVYWSESRPSERGRGVIMRAGAGGKVEELLPAPWSARSRVHEYGGGEFLADKGCLWFVEAESQDIYVLEEGCAPRRLTQIADTRFADMTLDRRHDRLICVGEQHADASAHAYPENFLASIRLQDGPVAKTSRVLSGNDFYAAPRVSPDGGALAWLSWDLPHMPWEAAALYVAEIGSDGALGSPERIAGGQGSAAFQPEWNKDGRLYYVCDETGWGNLYVWDGAQSHCIAREDADLMRPHWVFGMRSYALLEDGRIAAAYLDSGETRLGLHDPVRGTTDKLESGSRSIESLAGVGAELAVIGAGDLTAPAISRLDPGCGATQTLRSSMAADLVAADISSARMLEIDSGGQRIHALYYPPANASCSPPDGELPPVIVTAHGGPTGRADRGFKIRTQYWTSRGFGLCDVDYSGSAGYGRDFRKLLDGQWGIADVDDVGAAAHALIEQGLADPKRMIVAGGSAGGLTVLRALARHDLFAAGMCSYGVSDLAQLQRITHKFEGGYLYGLTGSTPENCEDIFAARSPVNLADDINAPVILFQGEDDMVVPPPQSRSIAATLERRGLPVAYYEFPGEGHGFRQAETIQSVLTLEYAFYCRILAIKPHDSVPDVAIENWNS